MPFEAFESSNLMHFVPISRLDISNVFALQTMYLIDY